MDGRTIACVREATDLDVPESANAVLIIEVDGDREFLDKQMKRITEIIQPLGVIETRIATTSEKIGSKNRVKSSFDSYSQQAAP